MTYEAFKEEVAHAERVLGWMSQYPMQSFPEYDLDLSACECAAELTGADVTTAKMLNKRFREDYTAMCFDMAREMIGLK